MQATAAVNTEMLTLVLRPKNIYKVLDKECYTMDPLLKSRVPLILQNLDSIFTITVKRLTLQLQLAYISSPFWSQLSKTVLKAKIGSLVLEKSSNVLIILVQFQNCRYGTLGVHCVLRLLSLLPFSPEGFI